MRTEGGKYYWVWYECRITLVETTHDNTGFIAFGQDAIWGMQAIEVIAEAVPPQAVLDEREKYEKQLSSAEDEGDQLPVPETKVGYKIQYERGKPK